MFPTTRKERFLYWRFKHTGKNRRRRYAPNQVRNKFNVVVGHTPQHAWTDGPRIGPVILETNYKAAAPPVVPLAGHFAFGTTGVWPTKNLWVFCDNDPYRFAVDFLNHHWRFAVVKYHQKRVKRRGRRVGGLRGMKWRLWQVVRFARINGWYPDGNEFGRHPTATEVVNGAPKLPFYTPHPSRRFAWDYEAPMLSR